MLKPTTIAGIYLITVLPTLCLGAERQIKAAREFKFEGIGLGTKIDQLETLHPVVDKQVESAKAPAIVEYYLPSRSASVIKTSSLDGQLYEMVVMYMPTELEENWRAIAGDRATDSEAWPTQ